ncbi:MAG: HipA family kinase [Dehalococcoidia bacterium]|nr:HipA family kinase [Dehalococcoidia bacterium]
MLRRVRATRYVTPLREGGSLPAIVEADDDGLYGVKFRSAGQGPKALIAELLAGELGRAVGLPIPELVFVDLDAELGRNEPDPEIQQLVMEGAGLNLGMDYLPGALGFDPVTLDAFSRELAAKTVWFDAFVTNVDRTPRNPNILLWHREPWLIDHGASFYFHHSWDGYLSKAESPFAAVVDHVLLRRAGSIRTADRAMRPKLTEDLFERVVTMLPDEWLGPGAVFTNLEAVREAYFAYLVRRAEHTDAFVEEAERARTARV